MAYVSQEARQDLLDAIADAIGELGAALAALGAAYEALDEQAGDRLEAAVFRPAQLAYGRLQRVHAGFAGRHGLPARTFAPSDSAGAPSQGVRGFLDRAIDEIDVADGTLTDLQDSLRPVEVGDAELRAGLQDVRAILDGLAERAGEAIRTFGR